MPRPPLQSLADIMAEDDARRLAEARAEMAAERAAWEAMTPDEQAAATAAYEAKYEALCSGADDEPNPCPECGRCGEPTCDYDCYYDDEDSDDAN